MSIDRVEVVEGYKFILRVIPKQSVTEVWQDGDVFVGRVQYGVNADKYLKTMMRKHIRHVVLNRDKVLND